MRTGRTSGLEFDTIEEAGHRAKALKKVQAAPADKAGGRPLHGNQEVTE